MQTNKTIEGAMPREIVVIPNCLMQELASYDINATCNYVILARNKIWSKLDWQYHSP